MTSSYKQNKKSIYNWVEKNYDKHLSIVKKYAQKNKEIIYMKNNARRRLGTLFYSFCNIYSNLYE